MISGEPRDISIKGRGKGETIDAARRRSSNRTTRKKNEAVGDEMEGITQSKWEEATRQHE
jgi:hypothetical protein